MSRRVPRTLALVLITFLSTLEAELPAQRVTELPKEQTNQIARPSLFDAKGVLIGPEGGAGGKFGGRRDGRRRLAGRSARLAMAIGSGLEWLQRHQDLDGGWTAGAFMRHDTSGRKSDGPGEGLGRAGITGFCLLAFLGDGSTLRAGPFRDVVRKAVSCLRRQQRDSGAFSTNVLEHAIASYAMCEAAGLSASEILGKEVRRALLHLIEHQNPDGGFGYDSKSKRSDSFTTAHALIAYKSGRDFRFVTDEAPFRNIERWRATTDGDAEAESRVVAPIADGVRRRESAIAARLLIAFFLGGDPKKAPAMLDQANVLLAYLPADDKQLVDPVYEYLTTYGMYQMGAPHWDRWSKALVPTLLATQRDDGNFEGSWDPVGKGATHGGRVYATALSVLMAESYYRYTRLVR